MVVILLKLNNPHIYLIMIINIQIVFQHLNLFLKVNHLKIMVHF